MITIESIWTAWVDLFNNNALPVINAGAPTDGGAGTGANICGPGTLLIDSTNANLYINTNTKASPSWSKFSLNTGFVSTGTIRSSSPTAGIGYTTGAGGTVSQTTNKATSVSITKVCGLITTSTATLNDATNVSFQVVATGVVTTADGVVVNHSSGGSLGNYIVFAHTVTANSFKVGIRNVSGGSLSEALVISYQVIKGASA